MRSIITFGLVGAIVTISHILTGLFAHYVLGIGAFVANLIAYAVGFVLGYFGHRNFSFRSKADIRNSMPKFFLVSLNNLLVNQVIVFVVVDVAGRSYILALLIMVLTIPILTYVLGRVWAFSDGDFS